MKIQEFIKAHLKGRLDNQIPLVIYDPEGMYKDLVQALANEETTVIDGSKSTILGREAAMTAWCRMGRTDDEDVGFWSIYPSNGPPRGRNAKKIPTRYLRLGAGSFRRATANLIRHSAARRPRTWHHRWISCLKPISPISLP